MLGLTIFMSYQSKRETQSIMAPPHMSTASTILRLETKHSNTSTGSNQSEPEDKFKVPNIVHYIWYADKAVEFRFDRVLGVLSAIKYIKPEAVYLHTNNAPTGKYFEMLKKIPIFEVTMCILFLI